MEGVLRILHRKSVQANSPAMCVDADAAEESPPGHEVIVLENKLGDRFAGRPFCLYRFSGSTAGR